MFPIQDTVQARGVPLVTWAIILLNGLVFFHELALPPDELEAFAARWGMVPVRLHEEATSYVTSLTCMFLHGGWTHFVGNMWMLLLFGDNVEDQLGHASYVSFYLLCGLAAGLTHYFANPTSTVPTIGASGAIAGVLGAYFRLFPTARIMTLVPILFLPLFFEVPAVVFLGVWFFSQFISGTLSLMSAQYFEGVAWWAHIGGFVAGMLVLPIFVQSQSEFQEFHADEYWPW
jgi:membrane associated rhomboid family serine protease